MPEIVGHPQFNGSGALRVAFEDAPRACSEFAVKTVCPTCTTVPCRTFADAIAAVERRRVDRAIRPVEGIAVRNYDLRIVQEINLFVHYCLPAVPGVRPGDLRRAMSHTMALARYARAIA